MAKKKLKLYSFSDGSRIIDDINGSMASQHVFCNPGLKCTKVEDYPKKENRK